VEDAAAAATTGGSSLATVAVLPSTGVGVAAGISSFVHYTSIALVAAALCLLALAVATMILRRTPHDASAGEAR
jgi:hypothetical protein